jgi:hypothetical protein
MADEQQQQDWSALGVAGALARNYAQDQKGFITELATVLEAALPPETVAVTRKPVHLFASKKKVVAIAVRLGNDLYTLEDWDEHAPLLARHEKIVKGIKLKTDEIPIHNWLEAVADQVMERAKTNEAAFFALRNFLEIKGL